MPVPAARQDVCHFSCSSRPGPRFPSQFSLAAHHDVNPPFFRAREESLRSVCFDTRTSFPFQLRHELGCSLFVPAHEDTNVFCLRHSSTDAKMFSASSAHNFAAEQADCSTGEERIEPEKEYAGHTFVLQPWALRQDDVAKSTVTC